VGVFVSSWQGAWLSEEEDEEEEEEEEWEGLRVMNGTRRVVVVVVVVVVRVIITISLFSDRLAVLFRVLDNPGSNHHPKQEQIRMVGGKATGRGQG